MTKIIALLIKTYNGYQCFAVDNVVASWVVEPIENHKVVFVDTACPPLIKEKLVSIYSKMDKATLGYSPSLVCERIPLLRSMNASFDKACYATHLTYEVNGKPSPVFPIMPELEAYLSLHNLKLAATWIIKEGAE
jgi:hypothetical protein